MEFYGITFDILGSKKTLGQTQSELKEFIENHGGTCSTIKRETLVTVLLTSKEDVKKSAKKLEVATSEKIAFLSVDWMNNLGEREGDGIALRQFAGYEKFLLNPKETHGDLKKIVSTPYQNKPKKKRKNEEEDEGEEKETKKKKKSKKRELKPVSGSDILKVDKDSELESKGEILMTYEEEFGW